MIREKGISTLSVIVLAFALVSCGVDYSAEMRKAFAKTFRDTFSNYQFFGMPVSGYGVGTMYPKSATNSDFDPTTSGLYGDPRTWWDSKLNDTERAQYYDELFGNAMTGQITVQLNKDTKFDLDVVLPQLYKLVSISQKDSLKNSVKVTLSADGAFNHRINWAILEQDLNKGIIQSHVKNHYITGDYLITTADIVLINYQATLVVTKSLDASAKVELTSAWKAFSKDASASFSFSDATSGQFTVGSKQPVVIATYIGSPPSGGVRAAGSYTVLPVQVPDVVRNRIIEASLYNAAVQAH